VRKLDGLLDWSMSTSYRPDSALDRQWANISSRITIKPGQSRNLSLNMSNTIDPYEWRILNTQLNYGLNLNGRFDTGGEVVSLEPPLNEAIERLGVVRDSLVTSNEGLVIEEKLDEQPYAGDFAGYERPLRTDDVRDPTEGGRYIPWNMSLNLTYSRSNLTGVSSARGNLSVSTALTANWDFTYRTSIDFDSGQVTNQSWNLRRDLHCWALEFSRSIFTNDQEFGFRIYLKSIPAIKVTRGREGLLGSASQFSGGIF
jgi:hypothetical protein